MNVPERLSNQVPRPAPPARARASAYRRKRARTARPAALRVAAIALVVLLVAGAAGGLGGWAAKQHADRLQSDIAVQLTAAAADLTNGKTAVSAANASGDAARLQAANADFESARRRFVQAQRLVDEDPLIQQTAGLPFASGFVGPRKRAVDDLAEMGIALADAGTHGAAFDAQLIKPGAGGDAAGARLVALLRTAGPATGLVAVDLERAQKHAAAVDTALLPAGQRAAFLKAKSEIQAGLAGIREFNDLSPVLLDMLGANGPRTYLVLNIDPAELRGGGGFIGSYILVTADKGAVSLGESKDVYQIDYPYPKPGQKGFVPPPNAMNAFATHGWVFGDANFYPDFPTSARAAEQLFQRETGHAVDGVVSIDPWAVAAMLEVTGPIPIPQYSTTVQASTFPADLVKRLLTSAANVPGRKTFFPVVANEVLARLTALPSDRWPSLISKLNSTVGQRHLQVYMNRDPVQSELAKLGWGGGLAPGSASETISEVESNFGGDKANYWLTRTYNLDLTLQGGQLQHRLGVALTNKTPPGYEGGQSYRAYFRFYCPAGATDTAAAGLLADKYASNEQPPAGLRLLDGWYQVESGKTYDKIAFQWTVGGGDLARGHSIYIQKQPGTLADKLHVTFHSGGHTYTVDTDLGQDRVIVLTPDTVKVEAGNTGTIALPSLG